MVPPTKAGGPNTPVAVPVVAGILDPVSLKDPILDKELVVESAGSKRDDEEVRSEEVVASIVSFANCRL